MSAAVCILAWSDRQESTVQNEGTRKVERVIAYYNLDMIISVGYRVHSYRGVQFRIWATKVLKEYIVKGFAMNDDFNLGLPIGKKIDRRTLSLPNRILSRNSRRYLLPLGLKGVSSV